MGYYIGIDVGTSGTKALLMGAAGEVLATATSDHTAMIPQPGWSEQDPDQWWSAAVAAVRTVVRRARVRPDGVGGIGLSGQMHGLVLLGKTDRPLRPAIIWNDQRTAPQAAEVERAVGGRRRLIRLAGNPAMTSYTLTKLLWVRQNQPGVYERARRMLLPKDYVRLRLTGEWAGDVSDMSGTLMLDQRRRDWSGKILDAFQIDRAMLPPLLESHEPAGRLTARAAEELGLPAGVPVVAGGGDQAVGAVGSGVVSPGLAGATIGTSGVMLTHLGEYRTDPAGRVNTYCAAVAGEYCMFGCVLSAGGSLQWFRNTLCEGETAEARRKRIDPYRLIDAQAAREPAGCGGLFWLPYLTGERTPHADPNARGCWIGLDAGTTKARMARAVMEGVTFAMRDCLELLGAGGNAIGQIRLSGGGARSALWRQIQADVYGRPCATMNTDEGPAYGAALLAATGTGAFANVAEACGATTNVTRRISPSKARTRAYDAHYAAYRALYPALMRHFAEMAKLTSGRADT
jgi:xylulokinase